MASNLHPKSILNSNGWYLTDYDTSNEGLIKLSMSIGEIISDDLNNKIHLLTPKEKGGGTKGSFSYNYGLSAFPYHTDTAFWSKPARYILMASQDISKCFTMLIDFDILLNSLGQTDKNMLRKSIFLLKTFNGIKFVSLLMSGEDRTIIRYDPNIMFPYNESSRTSIRIIDEFFSNKNNTPVTIKWTGKNALLIDNWRMFHARQECNNEQNRVLKRIYIK